MKRRLLCLVTLMLALPQLAGASTISSARQLQDACVNTATLPECMAYLEVVYRTAKEIARAGGPDGGTVIGSCGPDAGIDTVPLVVALRLAWLDYAAAGAGRLGGTAERAALRAFEEQWPCAR